MDCIQKRFDVWTEHISRLNKSKIEMNFTFVLLIVAWITLCSANQYHHQHYHHECPHHIVHKTKHVKVPVPVVKKIPEVKIIKVPVKVPIYVPIKEEKHYGHEEKHYGHEEKHYGHEEYPKHGSDYHYSGGDDYKSKA